MVDRIDNFCNSLEFSGKEEMLRKGGFIGERFCRSSALLCGWRQGIHIEAEVGEGTSCCRWPGREGKTVVSICRKGFVCGCVEVLEAVISSILLRENPVY